MYFNDLDFDAFDDLSFGAFDAYVLENPMAEYDSLTAEQKSILQAFTNFVRGWAGEQARANNHAEAANNDYNAQVSAIISSLDGGEVIPLTTGLAGAASLTKEDLIAMARRIRGARRYVLQQFRPPEGSADPRNREEPHPNDWPLEFLDELSGIVQRCELRGFTEPAANTCAA